MAETRLIRAAGRQAEGGTGLSGPGSALQDRAGAADPGPLHAQKAACLNSELGCSSVHQQQQQHQRQLHVGRRGLVPLGRNWTPTRAA